MSSAPSPPLEPTPRREPLACDGGRLRFGVFELELGSGELRKSGALVRLRQQPFKVLALLAAQPGRVVTREELRTRVWGDGTFVDFDQGLNYCIKEIRAALGDSADTPLYVETLPRRGYRFLAPIERVELPAPELLPAPAASVAPASAPVRAAWRRRLAWAHAALTLGALLVAGFLLWRPAPAPAEWRRATFRRGSLSSARFGPGGEIVYGAAWDGQPASLFAVVPGSPDARPLAVGQARIASVSTRGELAYLEDREGRRPVLLRAPLAGGPGKPLLEDVFDADANADGSEFAVTHVVAGEGTRIEYPIGHKLAKVNGPSHLRISPDGARLALIDHPRMGDDRGAVVVFDRAGRQLYASRQFASAEGLAWQPDGRGLLFTAAEVGGDSALRVLSPDGRDRLLLPASGRLVVHDAAPDGSLLIERAAMRGEIELVDSEGRGRDLSWFDGSRAVALSNDGRSLLVSESGQAGGAEYGVYLRPTDGSPPLRLGTGVATALSPDGRSALSISLSDPDRIDVLPIGAGQTRAIKHPGIVQYQWATFTPDGTRLVFVGGECNRNLRVWVADLAGGPPRAITPEGLVLARDSVSPDGASLIGPCAPLSFCIYPLAGGEPQPIPGIAGFVPVGWEASGRSIYVRPRGQRPVLTLERLELASGRRSPFREFVPRDPVGVGGILDVLVSRDGRALVVSYWRRLSELYVVGPLR